MNKMMSDLVAQVLFDGISNADVAREMPDSPLRRAGIAIENLITSCVYHLKQDFPNHHINILMERAWNIFGGKHILQVVGAVDTVTMTGIQGPGRLIQCVMFPENWVEMMFNEPSMQFGALVYSSSQALDAYNGQIHGQQVKIINRGRAHEAEFLLTLKEKINPGIQFNEYQKMVLEQFPHGILSADPSIWYPMKEPPKQ